MRHAQAPALAVREAFDCWQPLITGAHSIMLLQMWIAIKSDARWHRSMVTAMTHSRPAMSSPWVEIGETGPTVLGCVGQVSQGTNHITRCSSHNDCALGWSPVNQLHPGSDPVRWSLPWTFACVLCKGVGADYPTSSIWVMHINTLYTPLAQAFQMHMCRYSEATPSVVSSRTELKVDDCISAVQTLRSGGRTAKFVESGTPGRQQGMLRKRIAYFNYLTTTCNYCAGSVDSSSLLVDTRT